MAPLLEKRGPIGPTSENPGYSSDVLEECVQPEHHMQLCIDRVAQEVFICIKGLINNQCRIESLHVEMYRTVEQDSVFRKGISYIS